MSGSLTSGRSNQKQRTRTAIVDAARVVVQSDEPVSMPAVARLAQVSEATAYRYFPDLAGLLREALADVLPPADDAMADATASADVTERLTHAVRALLDEVVQYEDAVRTIMASAIARRGGGTLRAGRRFRLIEIALEPVAQAMPPETLEWLHNSLAVIVSADAYFNLTDLCGLDSQEATATIERLALAVANSAVPQAQPTAGSSTAPTPTTVH